MKKYIKYVKCISAFLLFFFSSLFKYIPAFLFKLDLNNINVTTQVYLSTFSNIVCFIILALMYRKDIVSGLKDIKIKKGKPLLDGFNYWFIGLMIMVLSNTILSAFSNIGTSTNEAQIRIFLESSWVSILSIAIISPIIEELVWRQSIYDICKNKWVYIFSSGIIFGALHVFTSPIASVIDVLYLIPYCSMGIAFAYTQYKTKNIIPSITLHIIHNSLNVVSTLLLMEMILW